VVVTHELIHSIHKSKEPRVIIKLDYEKGNDRVNLDFLLDILMLRGFGEKWIVSIKNIFLGGYVSVLPNGEESTTFKIGKVLRVGIPCSPAV
jgi:hypothetical protein